MQTWGSKMGQLRFFFSGFVLMGLKTMEDNKIMILKTSNLLRSFGGVGPSEPCNSVSHSWGVSKIDSSKIGCQLTQTFGSAQW